MKQIVIWCLPGLFLLLVIADAYTDAWRRKKAYTGKWWTRIYHGAEAAVYAGVCAVLAIWAPWYWCALYAVASRAAFFDPFYNLFMGHDLEYNGEGGSLIDRFENWTRIPIFYYRIGFLICYFILNLIYYLNLLIWAR